MATPYALFELESTSSTQDDATALLSDHPAVAVVARSQTAGRGRQGRPWTTATRALAVSVGFRPAWPLDAWPRLTLVAGLAAREVLGSRFALKWPNDLVDGPNKVAGLLAEASGDAVVIGLGANLFWPEPEPGAAAVYAEDPGPQAQAALARAFAETLLCRVEAGPDAWGAGAYRAACATLGARIRWQPDGVGTALDVAADGALIVDTASGKVRLTAGEVWEVRPAAT